MDHDRLAGDIVAARLRRGTLARVSDLDDSFDLSAAYDVAQRVSVRWSQLGHARCGVKIGLTNRGVWAVLGLNRPVWAPMYQDAVGGETDVLIGELVAPRIEAEVVVGLAHALGPGATSDEIAHAVGWAALGFELVDCHYPGWQLTPADLVADFGCHARLVVGEKRIELAETGTGSLAELAITLTCDDKPVAHGRGVDVLGGPLAALRELLAAPDAPHLLAGELVATGALTGGALPVTPGQRWRVIPEDQAHFAPSEVRMMA
ncbi:hydratase/decarboxylase [Mycolicibacterium rhodesiae JS60]|nr:hydratase/decarboxylase [Mycolicibacterium rhodesiae JS60]